MIRILLLALMISISQADVVGHTQCICKNYILESQCPGDCVWDYQKNTCNKPDLSTATTADQCYNVPGVWSPSAKDPYVGTCSYFLGCNFIKEYSVKVCQKAYPRCTYIAGDTSCSDYATSHLCSNQPKTSCYREGSDGFCTLNEAGTACVVATNCNQYPKTICPGEICQVQNGQCIMATCSQRRAEERYCTFVFNTLEIFSPQFSITACSITNQNPPSCQNAAGPSVLDTPELCETNTANTYTWSTTMRNQDFAFPVVQI